jgi:hypothetical protein
MSPAFTVKSVDTPEAEPYEGLLAVKLCGLKTTKRPCGRSVGCGESVEGQP